MLSPDYGGRSPLSARSAGPGASSSEVLILGAGGAGKSLLVRSFKHVCSFRAKRDDDSFLRNTFDLYNSSDPLYASSATAAQLEFVTKRAEGETQTENHGNPINRATRPTTGVERDELTYKGKTFVVKEIGT
jgi:GTPase SAR1 family protein